MSAFRRPASRVLVLAALWTACGRKPAPVRAAWEPLPQLQNTFGDLITVGNHPTPDQNGTGERLGLFRDPQGRVWGIPLTIAADGGILGCAPAGMRGAGVTDTIPAGMEIVGATNEPTGWRGGTGKLELFLKNSGGEMHSQGLSGGELAGGPVCWAPEQPGPPQKLQYYLIVPAATAK